MSEGEGNDLVEVLYDYSYEDESGVVSINVGDRYILLEKTNREWWHVKSPQGADLFYVPAQYVQIVAPCDEELYANQDSYRGNNVTVKIQHATPPSRGVDRGDDFGRRPLEDLRVRGDDRVPIHEEVLYANLEEVRSGAAKSPQFVCHEPSDYANLAQLEGDNQLPPSPREGDKGRRLVEYLPWFIYNENGPDRPYYVNIDTGERTFKPPRHKSQKTAERLSPIFPKGGFPEMLPKDANTRREYEEVVRDDGTTFYVHKHTKDKYEQTQNDSGSQYFFHVTSGESFWELPSHSPRLSNGDTRDTFDENRNRSHHTLGSQSLRISKAKSMYEDMDYMKGDNSHLKASTLPPSFSYSNKAGTNNSECITTSDRSSSEPRVSELLPISENSRPSTPTINRDIVDEPKKGYLNRAKITEFGKKVKKTWNQWYVVSHGSNICFYKDMKSSESRQGSPQVFSLQGAKVDFSFNSDVTSKKNVITLTTSENTQFLLQTDVEADAMEWLTKLKVAADDIQHKDTKDTRKAGDAQGLLRSQSVDEASGGVSNDRMTTFKNSTTYFRIRDKLRNLISRRPTQDDLVKRGIIKDTVFGANLQDLCKREHNTTPNFVKQCIAAVEKKGLDHDGLYRVSGNLAEIQKLRFMVDKEESYNLDDEDMDVHVLTGSLKLFFRELREPLFPFHMFDSFTTAVNKEKKNQRLRAFKDLMAELPRCNHDTMKMLFHHLKKVIDNGHLNRMQTQSVAIVFGPTLMWPDNEGMGMAVMTIIQSRVVEYMLLEIDELFR